MPGSGGMKRQHGEAMAQYRGLGWIARRRIDGLVIVRMLGSARIRSAGLLLLVVQLLVLSCAWRWDLSGWQRDLLRSAPALLVLPAGMAARRRMIEAILRADGQNREEAHRHSNESSG